MVGIIGEITGNIAKGLTGACGCLAAAFSVALVGMKATEAVGRNPEAAGKVLVQSILGMALAEAIAFYALFLS
jgi:F-type H+-transporting ATPase subunit c